MRKRARDEDDTRRQAALLRLVEPTARVGDAANSRAQAGHLGLWDTGRGAGARGAAPPSEVERLRGLAMAPGSGQLVPPNPQELLARVDRLAQKREPTPPPKRDLARDAWTVVEGDRVVHNVSP